MLTAGSDRVALIFIQIADLQKDLESRGFEVASVCPGEKFNCVLTSIEQRKV